ncbi:MAG: hypothetical protein L0214_03665, partial [candidate division NC10 bacterium]|nr:hypothetical protein [candidate division NC10 bacterium]
HGRATVVFGRFVMGVRAFLTPLAGAARMPFGQFLLVDSLGALIFFSDWPAGPGGGRLGCTMRAAGYLLMAACLTGLGGLALAETRAFLLTLSLFLALGYLVYTLRVRLERRARP